MTASPTTERGRFGPKQPGTQRSAFAISPTARTGYSKDVTLQFDWNGPGLIDEQEGASGPGFLMGQRSLFAQD